MSSSSKYIFGHAIMFLKIFKNFIKYHLYINGHSFNLFLFSFYFLFIYFILFIYLFFFFFGGGGEWGDGGEGGGRWGGYGPFKVILLTTSRSLKPEYPERKHLTLQNLASHMWPEQNDKHGGERPND